MSQSWTRSDNEVLATLQDVVATESINADLPGGERGEVGMVEYIGNFFEGAGIPYETDEVLPGRSNIIATLEGEDPDRVLLFECHMDTASVSVMTIPPFEPHIRDGLLYGRGACDTKAGGVAMMHAMKNLKEAGVKPPCTVKYAGAMDEEYIFRGALRLAATIKAEAAVISEPTELEVIRAHKGLARFRIIVKGVAAHSAKPYLGINAISKMARLIRAIEDEIAPTYASTSHPLTGSPTLNIGVISGGVQVNFVPDQCVIEIDRRVIPGETPEEAMVPFRERLERARAADPDLDVTLEEPFLMDGPMETPEDSRIVQVAVNACQSVLGKSSITGVPYGTDASKFAAVGIPAIVFGPGSIDQAHAAVEWVECEQVLKAVDIYQQIMTEF
ncbi:MAG: M20 family metallopeptidase [Candidatus Poribacteria bacterium]|nr:M20 family metallopeptidase [Candidatus Poribacteria bacterium]